MRTGDGKAKWEFLIRVGIFAFLCYAGLLLFPALIYLIGDRLLGSALGTFSAAAVANAIALRIYEQGQLTHVGLNWNTASSRNLALGVAGGVGAACLVLGPPLLIGAARIQPQHLPDDLTPAAVRKAGP